MEIDEYISNLRNKNIIISVQNEDITVNASDEAAITPEIIKELRSKKQEILNFFKSINKVKKFESIKPAPKQIYYPLSSAQRRMYFLYEFDKKGTTYNMPSFNRVSRNLNVSKLEQVFKDLSVRHHSLRTVFDIVDDIPVQRILDSNSFELTYYQGTSTDIDSYMDGFVRPFDLSKEPPVRVSLMDVIGEDYLLMIDMHHIINDGVSNEILMRDFWSLYNGKVLDDLRIQYVDYAVWQQSDAHQELVSKHKEYWIDMYSDELTSMELPMDCARPLYLSNEGAVHSFSLSKKQSDNLRVLASSQGVTMYTLFLAIYNVLLSKLSNHDDIVVGTPTAGRDHSELEELVGMFVNTLALRNRVDSKMSFIDLLTAMQDSTLMAFDHQLYQYEELVEALDVSRDAKRNPLFDVFFSYSQQDTDSGFSGNSDLQIVSQDMAYTVAKFDLSLNVIDAAEINISFNYRTDLFSSLSISRFSGYLEKIIKEVLEDQTQLLGDIEVLSKEEKTQLLVGFNDTKVDYDLDNTILDMFMVQSSLTPDAIALVFGEETLTYKELDVRSDLWASHLIACGVVTGDIVGLIMSRSSEMILAILAVMKSGGAYLPINQNQPISRTEHMLEDCQVAFVLSNVSTVLENNSKYTLLGVDALDKSIDIVKSLPCISSSDLAYIIYTSGSTGKPKGVMIQHEGLSNLIQHQQELFDIDSTDNILQFSPYYFDASVEQIWLALTGGGSLVLIDEGILLEKNIFNSYLREHKVTHIHSTPSFLERVDFGNLPELRRVVSGGEVCKPSLVEKISNKYSFYNEYGPTETTVTSTIQMIVSGDQLGDKVSIGKPIANTQAYILNNNMSLLPHGVIGELYLGGKGLSSGYLNRLDLTQESFLKNPFGAGSLYKTGDLARWLPDGTIAYFGRSDDQIKLNGVRIELGEIENHLNSFEGIKTSIVSLGEVQNNKSLIAYYITEEKIQEPRLKEYLVDRLPFSMLPTYYIQLDEFPIGATGKIDRRLLPKIESKERAFIAPSNEIEKQLVLIWSDILQREIENISVEDSFFEIGGNSLKAVSLVNTIFKIVSVKITLKEVFSKQTIREIADYIITVKQLRNIEADNKEEIKLVI